MKRLIILTLAISGILTLTACSNQQDNHPYSSKKSSTSVKNSTNTVRLAANDSINILSGSWEYDNFKINQIKAATNNRILELKVNWQNTSNHAAVFDDTAQITVSQNGNRLNVQQQDDDYHDNVLPDKTEDFEIKYQYNRSAQPITISIHPADTRRPTKTVKLQLEN